MPVDRPVGAPISVHAASPPERVPLRGQEVDIVPLDRAQHAATLFNSIGKEEHGGLWTYMFDGPFGDFSEFDAAVSEWATSTVAVYYVILLRVSGDVVGRAALMRIEPVHGVIEVGGIVYAPSLQQTRAATESMFLLARYVFETLGYRRYEWKCNALNSRSRTAALRLGFTFEGIFRQHMIVKGRNRDTAWYSMLDAEWPARKARFQRWLAPENFDADGRQRIPLSMM
jgi:RimJ/RimL family protein N-acetyltransferase